MPKLRIYHIARKSTAGYDHYQDCVVIAQSPSEAKSIAMDECEFRLKDIDCELLGNANIKQKKGIVCYNFYSG